MSNVIGPGRAYTVCFGGISTEDARVRVGRHVANRYSSWTKRLVGTLLDIYFANVGSHSYHHSAEDLLSCHLLIHDFLLGFLHAEPQRLVDQTDADVADMRLETINTCRHRAA